MAQNRLSRTLHALGLFIALVLPMAHASAQADPPGRVARLNYFSGTVTFAPSGSDDWARIQVNRPLISGDRIWVDRDSRSEIHVGSTALRLDRETSLSFLRLDDDTAQVKLTQGTLNLHVRSLASGQLYEVDTPNVAFSVQSPGTYRIDVAPDGSTTVVTIRHGSGTAYGANSSTTISAGQQLTFTGTDLEIAGSRGNPAFDEFDSWANGRDQIEDTSTTARYVSRDVIGYEQLDSWGSWRETPEYGAIWVPRVTAPGWAPYRAGHWDWISPWGWTWIDDAPWGFAPYHYGRWAYYRHSWCWIPGPIRTVRPVYAPALVVFVGGGSGFSFSLSFGGTISPSVGWFPLGPGEIYRPAYVASPTYVTNVNKVVVNNTTIINNTTVNKTVYVNQHAPNAITAVPVSVFSKGGSVTQVAKSVAPQQLHNTATISHAPPVTAPARGFVNLAQPVAPPPVRNTFERPVVTTSPAPGHRTVRAALAGQEPATVERDNKVREHQSQQRTPDNTGMPRQQSGQVVPQPPANVREKQKEPVISEPRNRPRIDAPDQPRTEPRNEPRSERRTEPRNEPRNAHDNTPPKQRDEVPRPPREQADRPVSRAEPSRPVVPQHEQRAAPASVQQRELRSEQPPVQQHEQRGAPPVVQQREPRGVPQPPTRVEPVIQAPEQRGEQRRVEVPRAPEHNGGAAKPETREHPQAEPRQEKRRPHEKEGERGASPKE